MRGMPYSIGPSVTPVVRNLIIVNAAVFIIQLIFNLTLPGPGLSQFDTIFALWPDYALQKGWIWQLFTYMFLHGGFFHILFNMFALWMFGSDLERQWGSRDFLRYYLVSGVGAGFFIALLPLLLGQHSVPTIGASGALFAILLAFAIQWPDRPIYFMMFFPIKAKYFVMIIGFISFYMTLAEGRPGGGARTEISHVGHLGGLITGYLYLLLRIYGFGKFNLSRPFSGVSKFFKMRHQKKLWKKKEEEMQFTGDWEKRVDELLEKIARKGKGLNGLTKDERKFLKEASRRMNEKHHSSGTRYH